MHANSAQLVLRERPDFSEFDSVSGDIIPKSSWADMNSSDEEGLELSNVTRTTSSGSVKTLSDDSHIDRTFGDIIAQPPTGDLSSEEEGAELNCTTRASSDGSTLTGPSSEDDFTPNDVTALLSLNTMQTNLNETQMVMKNTFLHVSDEVDEAMPKDIRRVQSCPNRLDCSLIPVHCYGSQLLALKSSWQYLRIRCEIKESSFRTKLATASLKESQRLPKRTQYKKDCEETPGIEYQRGDSRASNHAHFNISTDKPLPDGQRHGGRGARRAHGIGCNNSVLKSDDTKMDFGKKEDLTVEVQSSVPGGRHDLDVNFGNGISIEGPADEESPTEKETSNNVGSGVLIVVDDVPPPMEKFVDVCDVDGGNCEHSRTTYASTRLERVAEGKISHISKKNRQLKGKQPNMQQRQQPRPDTQAPCKHVQFSLGKSFKAIAENTGPFTVTCFLIVLIVMLGKAGVETNSAAESKGCYRGKLNPWITVTSEPRLPGVKDVTPSVTLYGPCMLDSFQTIAAHYTISGSAWNYVESQMSPKIEVRNYREEPSVMWKNVRKVSAIEEFLMGAMLPQVGRLTQFTSQFYGSLAERDEGLIVGLFEPDMEEDEVDDKYRPMLTEVAKAMQGKYLVSYMNTKDNRVWAESEFGAVSFPAIAINKEFPGKTVLYTGDMSTPAVLQFIRDIGRGCMRRSGREVMRTLMAGTQISDEVCEASPVLRA